MTEETIRIHGAVAVAEGWRQLGIPFLVLHGLEGFPRKLGRDLDVLMDQHQADIALTQASQRLVELGWRTAKPSDVWGKRIVAVRPDDTSPSQFLELHTMGALQWLLLPLLDHAEEPTHEVGPFFVSYWATFLKAIVSPVLAGDISRFSTEYVERHLRPEARDLLVAKIRDRFGTKGGDLIAFVHSGDPGALVRAGRDLRRACVSEMVRQPRQSILAAPRFLRKRILRIFERPLLNRVTLYGPDIEEIYQALPHLKRMLSAVFIRVEISPPRRQSISSLMTDLGRRGRQAILIDFVPSMRSDVTLVAGGRLGERRTLDAVGQHSPTQVAQTIADQIIDMWVSSIEASRYSQYLGSP